MTGQINFTVEQVEKLLAMQDQLNCYIHPEWKKQNYDWNFAIIDECREIKEHLGWKWWKEGYKVGLTEQNRKQVQLEVIDILHFVLSIACKDGISPYTITSWINNSNSWDSNGWDEDINWMMQNAITEGPDIFEAWHLLAVSAGLTTEQVIETYTQKFVLNKFRQDHGYKDGSYCKEWKDPLTGQLGEDNEVLEILVNKLKAEGLNPADEQFLYTCLGTLYNSRLNK